MVNIELLNSTNEGEVPFTVEFAIENSLAGQGEVEVRINDVLTDTIVVEPTSHETYSHTFSTPGQHVIHFLETVGGGGNPADIGYVFWALEAPVDVPGAPEPVRLLKMDLIKVSDPSTPSPGAWVEVVLPEGVSDTSILTALTPIFTAADWQVLHAVTETTSVDVVAHPNP